MRLLARRTLRWYRSVWRLPRRMKLRQTKLLPAQVRNTEARTANLEKTGDKHLVATSTDVGRIVDLAKQDFGVDIDGSTLRAASLSVAEHAKSLIVKQHMDP